MSRFPQIMGAKRAAEFLGISQELLVSWNRAGCGPPRALKGKRYYYTLEALQDWVKAGAGAARAAAPRASFGVRVPQLSGASAFPPLGPPHRSR